MKKEHIKRSFKRKVERLATDNITYHSKKGILTNTVIIQIRTNSVDLSSKRWKHLNILRTNHVVFSKNGKAL